MAQSNGGVSTSSKLTLYPMQNVRTGIVGFYAFDPSAGFADPNSGGFYSFKVEDVLPGRTPTIGQAVITYRDLGQVTWQIQVTGTTESQTIIVTSPAITVQFGNLVPTGRLMTKIVGINFPACQNPQVTLIRPPGAGPLSIAKVVICGRVEVQQEFA